MDKSKIDLLAVAWLMLCFIVTITVGMNWEFRSFGTTSERMEAFLLSISFSGEKEGIQLSLLLWFVILSFPSLLWILYRSRR